MKVSIIGVTGYGGLELIRYLKQHPYVDIVSIHSQSQNDQTIEKQFPHLKKLISLPVEKIDAQKIMTESELVFLATPSGISKKIASAFIEAQFPIIDLSGDFRLNKTTAYETWYHSDAPDEKIVRQFDYGLAELRKNPSSKWIANPGCYATAAELSFAPLLQNKCIELDSIIIDGKSGLSGAGKGLSQTTHFVDAHDNMHLYKMNQHQHIPEIVQLFQTIEPELRAIQFSTSLIPVSRGIFITAYAKLKNAWNNTNEAEFIAMFKQYYSNSYFVRIQEKGNYPDLKQVTGSNFCDIGLAINRETATISLVTAIDNLGKGAAGQAIQNMNIFAGFSEETGLTSVPIYV